MLPRVDEEAEIAIEIIVKRRQEFQSAAFAELGLPRAPAIMINNGVIVAGQDIDEGRLVQEIRRRLARMGKGKRRKQILQRNRSGQDQ